ncbi:MAG: hypothetical protein WBF39_11425 [Planococcus donghaensis]
MNLIKKSVELVNKNMVMIVPFLLHFIIVGGVSFIAILEGSLWFFSPGATDDEFYVLGRLIGIVSVSYPLLKIVGVFILVISLLIQAFVISGGIGMGKEVLNRGSANLSDFYIYGKKYFLKALLIEMMGVAASLLVMLPFFIYLLENISVLLAAGDLSIEFLAIFLVSGIAAAIVSFIAHFSMIPLIKDETGVWKAIRSSFCILLRGYKDGIFFLVVTIMAMTVAIIFSLVLFIIPIFGQVVAAIIQFYFLGVLLMWSMIFYDKYKDTQNEFKV